MVQVIGMGPHRASVATRPPWFFKREEYGGILCAIGSHQIELFLYFTGSIDAIIIGSHIANYRFKDYHDLQDFGDMSLTGNNGATGYFRLDWLIPDALETWADGRTFILIPTSAAVGKATPFSLSTRPRTNGTFFAARWDTPSSVK